MVGVIIGSVLQAINGARSPPPPRPRCCVPALSPRRADSPTAPPCVYTALSLTRTGRTGPPLSQAGPFPPPTAPSSAFPGTSSCALSSARPSGLRLALASSPHLPPLPRPRCVVVPLIVGSTFSGVLSLQVSIDPRLAKGIARRTLVCYLISMQVAVATGITCMSLFRPGKGVDLSASAASCGGAASAAAGKAAAPALPDAAPISGLDALVNTLRACVPTNVFAALASGNVLGLICVTIATALAIASQGDSQARSALSGAAAANAVIAKLVSWILATTPVCITSLIAAQIAGTCAPLRLLASLSYFVAVYLLGLLIHCGVMIPLAVKVVGRTSPAALFRGAAPAMSTVFATDSSSATMCGALLRTRGRRHALRLGLLLGWALLSARGSPLFYPRLADCSPQITLPPPPSSRLLK